MKPCCFYPVLLFIFSFASYGSAEDWPRFLGDNFDNKSTENGLARTWPEQGPKILWRFDLDEGFGGTSIRDGKVYTLDRVKSQNDVLRCLELETGKELWNYSYKRAGRLSYNGSRSTPTVEEDAVYIVGPFGDVHCIDLKTHQPRWHVKLEDHDGEAPNWGYAHSPLVYKDFVIVAPMGYDVGMMALDKKTGEVKWKTGDIGGNSYASPVLMTLDGVEQIVMITREQVCGIAPDTGKILWWHRDYSVRNAIPDPMKISGNRIFATGGYDAGSAILEINRNGEEWSVTPVRTLDYGAMLHAVIVHEDHLYANLNENSNLRRSPRSLVCMDLNGQIIWQTGDEPNIDRGAILLGDGLLFVMGGQDGILRLVEADPQGYKERGSIQCFDLANTRNNNIWAPLALSGGKLIVRSQSQMVCLDVSKATVNDESESATDE